VSEAEPAGRSAPDRNSEALGREIRYGGNDLESWEQQARQAFPAWMAYDFRIMYAMFHEGGFTGTPEDLAATRELLGRDPTPFSEFVRETAAAWG
jgi:hypothetical protein